MTNEYREKLDNLLGEFQYCQNALNAIGDETRQYIICEMLKNSGDKGMRVIDITQTSHLSRPAVSHHMQILKEAGIVHSYKEKTMVYYYLDPDAEMIRTMARLMDQITELTEHLPHKDGIAI